MRRRPFDRHRRMFARTEASTTITDLIDLPLTRYPAAPLLIRAYELRWNVIPYDATYVALAEGLECPLFTGDVRLTRARGIRCEVAVFTG